MKRALLTISGVVALWSLGMLALILWYIPGINHQATLCIATAGGIATLILLMSSLNK